MIAEPISRVQRPCQSVTARHLGTYAALGRLGLRQQAVRIDGIGICLIGQVVKNSAELFMNCSN